jgi:hypothetical protein
MDLREANDGQKFRHPWETARCTFVFRKMQEWAATRSGHRILDAGSGDAWLASQLLTHFPEVTEIRSLAANSCSNHAHRVHYCDPYGCFRPARSSARLLSKRTRSTDNDAFANHSILKHLVLSVRIGILFNPANFQAN